MKKIRLYIPNVLLTLLLLFSLLGTELSLLAKRGAMSIETFQVVVQQQNLTDKAYDRMETYFNTRSNSTGIPAEVFLVGISKDDMYSGILSSVSGAFAYLNGESSAYKFSMDFTELESSVRTFFDTYAEQNGYAKDAVFEEKVSATIEEAETQILSIADNFKFTMLYERGWLGKVRKVVQYLNYVVAGCIALTVLLVVLLILCNLKQLLLLPYWFGMAALVSGMLLTVPCLYIVRTNYFSGFVIKDPQIYAAVVGYLNLLTNRAMVMAVVTMCMGIVGFAGCAVLRWFQKTDAQ